MKDQLTPAGEEHSSGVFLKLATALSLSLRYLDKSDTKGQTLTKHIHSVETTAAHTSHLPPHIAGKFRSEIYSDRRENNPNTSIVQIIYYKSFTSSRYNKQH